MTFLVYCGGCHFTGSSINPIPLGDPNVSTAFAAAVTISSATWLARVTTNPYINAECNLLSTDGVYSDLNAWLQSETCN